MSDNDLDEEGKAAIRKAFKGDLRTALKGNVVHNLTTAIKRKAAIRKGLDYLRL